MRPQNANQKVSKGKEILEKAKSGKKKKMIREKRQKKEICNRKEKMRPQNANQKVSKVKEMLENMRIKDLGKINTKC